MAGQSGNPGGTVSITAPAGPVRGLFRPRPWAGPRPSVARSGSGPWTARTPEPGTHGRIADGGGPKSRLEAHNALVSGV